MDDRQFLYFSEGWDRCLLNDFFEEEWRDIGGGTGFVSKDGRIYRVQSESELLTSLSLNDLLVLSSGRMTPHAECIQRFAKNIIDAYPVVEQTEQTRHPWQPPPEWDVPENWYSLEATARHLKMSKKQMARKRESRNRGIQSPDHLHGCDNTGRWWSRPTAKGQGAATNYLFRPDEKHPLSPEE